MICHKLTPLECQEILNLYQQGTGFKVLMSQFHTSYLVIRKILDSAGVMIRQTKARLPTDEIVISYQQGKSIAQLAKQYRTAQGSVRKILHQAQIRIRKRKYNLNHQFLSEITPNSAYFIGFFLADGHLLNPKYQNYRLSFKLQKQDIDILTQFNHALSKDNLVKVFKRQRTPQDIWKEYAELTINSQTMYQRLSSWGVTCNKSISLNLTSELCQDLGNNFSHFLRGYFDGDGCLRFFPSGRGEIKICVTSQFGQVLRTWLTSQNITSSLINDGKIQALCLTKQSEVLKFLTLIYRDAEWKLSRKYDLYLRYLTYVTQCTRPKIFAGMDI